MKTFLLGCGALIVGLVLGAGAVLAYTFFFAPVTPSAPTAPRTGQSAIRIIVDEAFVNRQAAAMVKGQSLYSDPQVDLRAPNLALVTVSTRVDFGGIALEARPTTTVQFSVAGGKIKLTILDVNVGGLGVPRSLVEASLVQAEKEAENQANQAISKSLAGTGLKVTGVSATDTSLVVELGE